MFEKIIIKKHKPDVKLLIKCLTVLCVSVTFTKPKLRTLFYPKQHTAESKYNMREHLERQHESE